MSICSVSDDEDETDIRELLLTEEKHCVLCNFSTKIEEVLEKHRAESHAQQACTLDENVKLPVLKPVVKPLPLYKCSECSFATITTDELQEHKKDKHKKEEPATSQTFLHKCISCSFNTDDFAKLGVHIDSDHNPETSVTNPGEVLNTEQSTDDVSVNAEDVTCPFCVLHLKNLDDLKKHIEITHLNNRAEQEKSSIETFPCQTCGLVLASVHLLQEHIISHKPQAYPCAKCNDIFSSEGSLNLHLASLHAENDDIPHPEHDAPNEDSGDDESPPTNI